MKTHNYKRICKLGKGSFGDVQLIENIESKKLYALKRLDISNCELPTVLNEVCLLQQLDHPNIIKYHEYFKDERKICIVMEYADNGDLFNQVYEAKKAKITISESMILNWFTQLCLALNYLHKRHVIHRDVKLQNIFLTKEGLIKLGDFGVSKKLENTDDLAKTSLGTPYYISPEICQGKPYNNKSDVWMLGCVLYELCTLERAFDAYSLHTLVKKIVEEGHQKVAQKYSLFVKTLIDEMLEKDPEKRPKISEILEKKEIKLEVRKLTEKHPKIFGNLVEFQPNEMMRRDNKSISFHDYLIKKRNSLADDEENEVGQYSQRWQNLKHFSTNDPQDPNYIYNNNSTCKENNPNNANNSSNKRPSNHQSKLSSIHINYQPPSILSRKISLPEEVPIKSNDFIIKGNNHNNNINKSFMDKVETPTVKNSRNELNAPLQAYFFNNRTPNFKNAQHNNNISISNNIMKKEQPYQLKTPQHNAQRKAEKSGEKTSFVDFLQKRNERKFEDWTIEKTPKKLEQFKEVLIKILGEEKFRELGGLLKTYDGDIEWEKMKDLMGGGNRGLVMLRELCRK